MALTEFDNGVAQASRVRSQRGRARALFWSGRALARMGKEQPALERFDQAAKLQREMGFPRDALRTQLTVAEVWNRRGEYARAAKLGMEVEQQAVKLGDADLEIRAVVRQGYSAWSHGEHPQAREKLGRWLALARRNGIHEDVCVAQADLAQIQINLGEFSEARNPLAELGGNARCQQPQHVAARRMASGILLIEEGRFAESLVHFRAMLSEAEANQQSRRVRQVKNQICTAAVLSEPKDKALKECGDAFRAPADAYESASTLYVAADLFLLAGEYPESIRRANLARELLIKADNLDDTLYSTLIRGQAEVRLGDLAAVEATRRELQRLRGMLVARWGETTVATYLKRSLYASRWNEVFGAQAAQTIKEIQKR